MSRPTVPQVIREESARQAVIVAAGLVLIAAGTLAERHLSNLDRDAAHRWRMAAWRTTERAFARAAAWSWGRAEWARLGYERAR